MKLITAFLLLILGSCTVRGVMDNFSADSEFFTKLVYSDAKQFVGVNPAEGYLEVMDENTGIPIDGGTKSKSFR
ncbi:MAG: hypothetical protein ACRCWI_07990, partial [Brevinema sp.]